MIQTKKKKNWAFSFEDENGCDTENISVIKNDKLKKKIKIKTVLF
jgi:hypothetical protein